MLTQGAYGNVHVGDGLLVGLPAVGGVLAGTWLQQRVAAARRCRCCSRRCSSSTAITLRGPVIARGRSSASRPACVAGMLGVGGGILFVPALVLFLGLGQVDAEATSLLAIIPVALVGAWRQHALRQRARCARALVLGALAVPGAFAGVALVNAIPERVTRTLFALLMLYVAYGLVRRGLREPTVES